MADVVETTVLLADINEFGAMNEIYAEFFEAPYPARAAFQVAALPRWRQGRDQGRRKGVGLVRSVVLPPKAGGAGWCWRRPFFSACGTALNRGK
jgi:enamine deaminase RidA (YjgF/YER057c/UK114 family)